MTDPLKTILNGPSGFTLITSSDRWILDVYNNTLPDRTRREYLNLPCARVARVIRLFYNAHGSPDAKSVKLNPLLLPEPIRAKALNLYTMPQLLMWQHTIMEPNRAITTEVIRWIHRMRAVQIQEAKRAEGIPLADEDSILDPPVDTSGDGWADDAVYPSARAELELEFEEDRKKIVAQSIVAENERKERERPLSLIESSLPEPMMLREADLFPDDDLSPVVTKLDAIEDTLPVVAQSARAGGRVHR